MQSTQSRNAWLLPGIGLSEHDGPERAAAELMNGKPPAVPAAPSVETHGAPPREHDAHIEIVRLHTEIEQLVRNQRENPREAVDSALESVTRLQVVTANIEACRPPSAIFAGAAMVALADARLRGHADAIERGMTYTADNQLRLLHDRPRSPEEG
jgi:hypothetical protein